MRTSSKKPFVSLLKGSWDSTADERPRLYLFTIFFIIAYALDLLVPLATGYTLGVFVEGGMSDETFHKGLLGIAAFTLLRLGYALFHHIARYIQNHVAYTARMNSMSETFNAYMDFSLRWHVNHHSGENLSKLHRSAGAVNQMVGVYVWQVIEGAVKVVGAGVAIFALDFWVAASLLTLSSFTIGAMIFFNRRLTISIRKNNVFYDRLNRVLVDYLSNIVTVKTLGVEQSGKRHLRSRKNEGLRLNQIIAALTELKWGATGVGYALVISSALLIYFYSHRVSGTAIDVARVYVLLNYLDRIYQAIGSFTGYYSGIIESSTAYEDATAIYDQLLSAPGKTHGIAVDHSWSSVFVRDLTFSYVAGEHVGVNKVSFELSRGDKVALVGQSGSGKSTLLKIFGGLLEPDTCTLSTNLQKEVTLDDFVPQCLLIPQEPEIFSESVYNNLTMGEEFDAREISFFISLCKLDAVISKLPCGLQSSLAEKGLNLSVGEKQRIALARGLVRAGKKDVLLLDEPTSSLDPKTEKEIFLGLLYHFASRTVISSCHRLNLIPLFDKIIMMSNGAIIEMGTFADLIQRRSHFYKIWEDYQRNLKQTEPHAEAANVAFSE